MPELQQLLKNLKSWNLQIRYQYFKAKFRIFVLRSGLSWKLSEYQYEVFKNALENYNSEIAWLILCDALMGDYGFLEEAAAELLFQHDKLRAIQHLISAFAMSHLDNPRKGDWISTARIRYRIQQKLIDVLVQIGESAFDDLLTALEHPNFLLRDGVAKTLKELGDKRAVEALWQAKDNTPYAIVALAHLDYENKVDAIIAHLTNNVPRYDFLYIEEIADIFGEHQEQKAISLLVSYLENWTYGYFYPAYFTKIEAALLKIAPAEAQNAIANFRAYTNIQKEELGKISAEEIQAFFRPNRNWYIRLFPFNRNH